MKFDPNELLNPDLQADKFTELALEVFKYQYAHNSVYRQYCNLLDVSVSSVTDIDKIPFLPIEFFKQFKVVCDDAPVEAIFRSSTTTGFIPSEHHVSLDWYEKSFLGGFMYFYGMPGAYCIIGVLPSYLERGDSSLVYMVDRLMRISGHKDGGFYLYDYSELEDKLQRLTDKGVPLILFGVTFALLDLAERRNLELSTTIIIETGGMKGRRKELIRSELHDILHSTLRPKRIDSEYGMTELLSQGYKIGDAPFRPVPWMKVLAKEVNDPFGTFTDKTGLLHIIDLANIYSCSFIATKDLGRVYPDGTFEVSGRYDHSEARGCNLMVM
ncbi:acyl transferase [Schleiferia thermophila]|uniref:LuxE/PaaK family acyltransferase n=1 Tax=Schleiferia thermophila TaxID=884107 RepID=UPI003EEAF730